MSLKIGTQFTQGGEIFYGEKASVCKGGVKSGGCVALGQDKTISFRFVGVLRVNVHFFKVEIGKDICCGKGSAGMTASRPVKHFNNVSAHCQSFFFHCFIRFQFATSS